jgi:predicted HAD superfamily hydrolase
MEKLQLIDRILKYEPRAVLIDFFDTVVTRTIHPEDVKRLASRKLASLLDGGTAYDDLYAIRADLERELCKANAQAEYDAEFNFLVLKDRLSEIIGARYPQYAVFVNEWLIDTELASECAVQRVDSDIRILLQELRQRKIPTYLVSDFYLPKSLFVLMLEHHGIADLFADIFVSSDDLLTKRSGRRYSKLLTQLAIPAECLVMIGDNPEADIQQAMRHGIHAIQLDRSQQHHYYSTISREFGNWRTLVNKINKAVLRQVKDSGDVFPELAVTLYYFTDALFQFLARNNIKDVFFLAREGQFLRVLFEDYQNVNGVFSDRRIRSHYLEVSRRSTFLPSLRSLDEEDFETLFRQYRRISLREFLESLGLAELMEIIAAEIGFDPERREEDFAVSHVFSALKANPMFRKCYEEKRRKQLENFCRYLNSFPTLGMGSSLAMVDVGWKGTIQDNLFNILKRSDGFQNRYTNLEGLYIGLIAEGNASDRNRKTGLLFSAVDGHSDGLEFFNENRSLFEVMLGADHGSVKEYKCQADGMVRPVHDAFDTEQPLYESHIAPIQMRMRERFGQIARHFLEHGYLQADMHALVTRLHARMVLSPSRQEIKWIKSVFHVENFGVFELSHFGKKKQRIGLMDRIRFSYGLICKRASCDLGFWPWLTIRENALPMMHLVYAVRKLTRLEKPQAGRDK